MQHYNFGQYCEVLKERRFMRTIKRSLSVLFLAGLMAVSLSAAPIIEFQVTTLGSNLFRYNFTLSGIDLMANQEIDIQFDPHIFAQLSNGVAGPGFDLLLFQPNTPLGVHGDYSALALVNLPSITGPFSVNFTLLTGAVLPTSQPFFIFDDSFFPAKTLVSGSTTAVSTGPVVPEPGGFWLCGLALLVVAGGCRVRRRLSKTV
jgi:hypothetical protein